MVTSVAQRHDLLDMLQPLISQERRPLPIPEQSWAGTTFPSGCSLDRGGAAQQWGCHVCWPGVRVAVAFGVPMTVSHSGV